MTDEIKQEILDFIKAKTGAASVFVLLSTGEAPCKETLNSTIGCVGHLSTHFSYGIARNYLSGFVHSFIHDFLSDESEEDVDK